MATNRADTLDPALLRPGRLDRKIEFPQPSRREKRLIFQTITSKMNLGPDLDLEDCKLSTEVSRRHTAILIRHLPFLQMCLAQIRSPPRRLPLFVRPRAYKVCLVTHVIHLM